MRNTSKTGVRLLSALVVLSCGGGLLLAQTMPPASTGTKTTSTQSPLPAKTPSVAPTPNATPLPQSTPFVIPNVPGPSMTPAVTPAFGSTAAPVSLGSQTPQNDNRLTLEEALRLANAQASSFQQAGLNEKIAAEDVRQAQAAFLPKVSAPLSYIYTSPALGPKPGEPRVQRRIANKPSSE